MNGWVPKRSLPLSPFLSEYFSPHPRSPLLSPPDFAVALTSQERKGSSPYLLCISTLMPYFSLSRQATLCLRTFVRKREGKKYLLCLLRVISPPLFLYRARRYDTCFATDEGVYMDHPRRQERASQKGGDGGRLRGNEGCWTNVFRSLPAWLLSLPPPAPESSAFFPLLAWGNGRDCQSSLYRL